MKTQILFCLFGIALVTTLSCGSQATYPRGAIGSPCVAAEPVLVVENGIRYFGVRLPDGQAVLVRIDPANSVDPGSPGTKPGGPSPGNLEQSDRVKDPCPCDKDDCKEMCLKLPPPKEKLKMYTCPAPK
jgi:hypothetical protein